MDKEWKKLETFQLGSEKQGKSKREVVLEAQRDKWKVHFATLMDICHLKSAELEPKFQGSSAGAWMGECTELGMSCLFIERTGLFFLVYVMAPMWKKLMENVDLDEHST